MRWASVLLVIVFLIAGLWWIDQAPPRLVPNIIYDDDCSYDVDCVLTLTTLHRWIDTGQVRVRAMVADAPNTGSAPVMRIWNVFFGHGAIPVGTYKGTNGTAGAGTGASTWTASEVSTFATGDSGARYPDCVTVYRQALAAAGAGSVRIVATGIESCLAALLHSGADSISPLTGAQLVKQRVAGLYLMGGDYPTGAEYNLETDPADAASVFNLWTSQNGFPPIYLFGFTEGNSVIVGPASRFPATNPAPYALRVAGYANRPAWDQLALYGAVFSLRNFTLSANGTNTVNATTGANSFSAAVHSGHYYTSLARSISFYEAMLDGAANEGTNYFYPRAAPRGRASYRRVGESTAIRVSVAEPAAGQGR